MKKSKVITIGLLVISILSCHKKEHKDLNEWNHEPPVNYVDGGSGYYHHIGFFPYYVFYSYKMNNYGGLSYEPSYGYHSKNGFRSSSFGHTATSKSFSGSSHISRGGFGHSGSGHVGS